MQTKKRLLGFYFDTRCRFVPKETRYERLVRLAFALRRIGVSEQETARLIRQHRPDTIERILEGLPWRRARNRASYVVSAIDNGPVRTLRKAGAGKPLSRPR